jgi:Holliday junction resolvase RusA-like endonuclease
MKFTLDLAPISTNSFWGQHGHRKYISAKGRTWREYIQLHIKSFIADGTLAPFEKESRLEGKYTFNFKGKRKRDTANYEKPLTDCFEGLLFDNDEQIDRWVLERNYNCGFDHVIIEFNER